MDTVTPQSSMSLAQREALADAMRGDWTAADAMELEHLNASKKIRARITEQLDRDGIDYTDRLRAIELEHARGMASITAVVWSLSSDCQDCDGTGTLEVLGNRTHEIDCPSCDGTGSDIDEDTERVRTDIDGNVLGELQDAVTAGLFA